MITVLIHRFVDGHMKMLNIEPDLLGDLKNCIYIKQNLGIWLTQESKVKRIGRGIGWIGEWTLAGEWVRIGEMIVVGAYGGEGKGQ